MRPDSFIAISRPPFPAALLNHMQISANFSSLPEMVPLPNKRFRARLWGFAMTLYTTIPINARSAFPPPILLATVSRICLMYLISARLKLSAYRPPRRPRFRNGSRRNDLISRMRIQAEIRRLMSWFAAFKGHQRKRRHLSTRMWDISQLKLNHLRSVSDASFRIRSPTSNI